MRVDCHSADRIGGSGGCIVMPAMGMTMLLLIMMGVGLV
jgi:hypothetical protein